MYKKEFTVRWSEIDPNMHLTSSAYVKYVTDARMSFFEDQHFGLDEMRKYRVGPIVLSEKCYYFKEVYPGEKITVSLEKCGHVEDFSIIELEQRIFNNSGENNFLSLTLVAFMDAIERKITQPKGKLLEILKNTPKSPRFKILDKSELRDKNAFPVRLG